MLELLLYIHSIGTETRHLTVVYQLQLIENVARMVIFKGRRMPKGLTKYMYYVNKCMCMHYVCACACIMCVHVHALCVCMCMHYVCACAFVFLKRFGSRRTLLSSYCD